MKSGTSVYLRNLLHDNMVHLAADLYEFYIASGTQRYTSGDATISYGGNNYTSAVIQRGPLQGSLGGEVATLELELVIPSFVAYATAGSLDGIQVAVRRSYSTTTYGETTDNVVIMFDGYVVDVEPGSSTVRLVVKSKMVKAEQALLPKRIIQPACPFQVYDADCGVTKATFTHARTAASGTTASVVKLSSSSTMAVAGSWLLFTSGAFSGTRALVRSVSGVDLTLDYALPSAPGVGDGIDVIRGCDKVRDATCDTVFSNVERYGGFPQAAYETAT
jgi:hypothetical protein